MRYTAEVVEERVFSQQGEESVTHSTPHFHESVCFFIDFVQLPKVCDFLDLAFQVISILEKIALVV